MAAVEDLKKEHFVFLIEDGTDMASGRKVRVNLIEYIEKYNFQTNGKEIKDPQKRYFMTLK